MLAMAPAAVAQPFAPNEEDRLAAQGQAILAREHPQVIRHMARNDGFGGPSSPLIARQMLRRSRRSGSEHSNPCAEG